MDPSGKKTITGLAAAHLVTDIYMPVLPAILPLLIATNGYSYLAAGLLVTAYNVTSSFTQPVVGWLSDSRGFSVSISISLFVSAVFVALMGVAPNYYLIMLFAIIAALGHACFHPTALSLVNRLCTTENRGRITSYFVVGGNLGYAIGPVLAGALVFWLGLPGLMFLIFPAIFMLVALRYLLPGGISGACQSHARPESQKKGEQSKKPFIILMAASVLRAWAVFAAITFLPMYLVTLGYDLMTASIIMTLMLLAGVAGQVMGGYISDRIGRKEFMILGLAVCCSFLLPVLCEHRHHGDPCNSSLRVLSLVNICGCSCHVTRTPASEYRACIRHDAGSCNRVWRPGGSGQWYDCGPVLSRCSTGNDPHTDCCSDAAYDYPSLPVEIVTGTSCRPTKPLTDSIPL